MKIGDAAQPMIRRTTISLIACLLVACAGGANKVKPIELIANVPISDVRLAWTAQVGAVNSALNIAVTGINNAKDATITVASSGGVIASFEAASGRQFWRAQADKPLSSGAGTDDDLTAVVTDTNELLVFNKGSIAWRQKLVGASFTSPLLKNGKIFVLGSDRSLTAFDAANGLKLWSQKRSNEALALRQSGVLLATGDGLVASSSGKLMGLNPLDGSVRWERSIATARGTNDVERLVDLVGRVSVNDDVVCARAYRVSVGCLDAARGNLLWAKPAVGTEGVQGDAQSLFGTESDGKVIAWSRANGEKLWVNERLLGRTLSAPVVFDKYIVVGDSTGLVHLLSTTDGSVLTRLTTDGSAVAAAPIVAGKTLVVLTRRGGVFGFAAE
jgi:outer membrane protein assembly factor BamB